MSIKLGIGETVVNDYVHTLSKWAEEEEKETFWRQMDQELRRRKGDCRRPKRSRGDQSGSY